MRILLVDDDAIFRSIARSKLALANFEVHEAADGASGWMQIQSSQFDLALIDLGLPDMNGADLIRRVRRTPRTSLLPIMVITGREDREAIDEAFDIGANHFLTKPINWPLFRHQVAYVVRMAQAERMARRAQACSQAESRLKDTIIGRLNYVLRPEAADLAHRAEDLSKVFAAQSTDAELLQYAESLCAQSQRLEQTIEDMAHFAILLSEGIEFSSRSVSDTSLMQELMRKYQSAIDSGRLEITKNADAIWLSCDADQLIRALSSLVDNALRFSPVGSAVRVSTKKLNDSSLCITVDDEGSGIPPEKLVRLLAPMSSHGRSDRNAHDVSGLGLAVAKFVAEAHGGSLTVQSALGRGTTAFVHLPAELIELPQADAA